MTVGSIYSFTATESVVRHYNWGLTVLTGIHGFYIAKLDILHEVKFLVSSDMIRAADGVFVSHFNCHHNLFECFLVDILILRSNTVNVWDD